MEEVGGQDLVLEVFSALVVGHDGRHDMMADHRCTVLCTSLLQAEEAEVVGQSQVEEDVESKDHAVEGPKLEEHEIVHKARADLDLVGADREDVDSRHEVHSDYRGDEAQVFCHKVDRVHWRMACLDERDQARGHPVGSAGH